MSIHVREADLNQCPRVINSAAKHVSLGELHGNALKLLYVLIEEGILELKDPAHYEQLRDIYSRGMLLTTSDLLLFRSILADSTVKNNKAITLIGDELADRGTNDYLTLLVLKKLHSSAVNIDILLSNHSAEFIRDYAKPQFTGRYNLRPGQGQSLASMQWLISRGLVSEDEIREIVELCYQPMVKAISYTLSPQGELTVFTHAPTGLEMIKALAKKFNLAYSDNSARELIKTIDRINAKVAELFLSKQLSALIDAEGSADMNCPISPERQPLHRLIWNRVVGDELLTTTASGMNVHFVHGHIGANALRKKGCIVSSHQNLDTLFGKAPECFQTQSTLGVTHLTRHSNDLTALELTDTVLRTIANAEVLKIAKTRIDGLLAELKIKTDELIAKGTVENKVYDKKYIEAAHSARQLYQALNEAQTTFFAQQPTKKHFIAFTKAISHAIDTAKPELSKHRDTWHELNPILKGFLGVIALLFLGIPALIASRTAQGYVGTFFSTGPTDSEEQLDVFAKRMQEELCDLEKEIVAEDELTASKTAKNAS